MNKYNKIALLVDESPKATRAARDLNKLYSFHKDIETADCAVVLSGDGFMLHSLHKLMKKGIPLYGMNRGTLGFLLNEYNKEGLFERIAKASKTILHPLEMKVTDVDNNTTINLAVNEVSMLRETYQAASLKIAIDDVEHLPSLVSDGVIIATPAGSSAYNLSANGPVIPLSAKLLALTPISPFRPRRWRGALLPADRKITVKVNNPKKRPVSAVADFLEIRNVKTVEVRERKDIKMQLLFDEEHRLEERLIKEQFASS